MRGPWTVAILVSLGLVASAATGDRAAAGEGPDADHPRPLDAAAYEALILSHASCEVSPRGDIDPECPALKASDRAFARDHALDDLHTFGNALADKLIAHSSPAVRLGATRTVGGVWAETRAFLLAAARKETHAGLLARLLSRIGDDGAKDPGVAEALLAAADHTDAIVRMSVVRALSSPKNRAMVGAADKLIALMTSDADLEVRRLACTEAGDLADSRFVAAYKNLIAEDPDPKLRAACLMGLVRMWWPYPFPDNANKDAYKLTVALLAEKPRDAALSWSGVFALLGHRDAATFATWKKNAPWYNEAALNRHFVDMVKDSNLGWQSRAGAAEALWQNGATQALKALLASFPEDAEGEDATVRKALVFVVERPR